MSSKSKTTQTQTQSGTGGFTQSTTPQTDTEDIKRLRAQEFKVDPSIGFRVGGALRRMKDQMTSPTGGYGTAQTRDAIGRSQERSLLESGSQAMREGQNAVNQQEFGRNATLAGLTQGTTASGTSSNTGTMTGSGTQSTPMLGQIIGSAAGIGAAALTLLLAMLPQIAQ